MKTLNILLFLFLFAAFSFGQNAKTSTVKSETLTEIPAGLKEFVPAGYSFLGGEKGNLNLDKYADIVLVFKKDNEKETSDVVDHPEKRPLLIFLGQSDGSYKLEARNDNTVYCVDCGGAFGDPFDSLTITNGNFSVNHYGGSSWRWTRIVTYKYSPADKNWYLFRDGSESFNALEPNKVTTEIKTVKNFGKVSFKQFDIYKEEK
jgi:hypothetical protein